MDKDQTYNGWSNYATWRVNLEIVDGTQWTKEDFVSEETELIMTDLADHIKNACEQTVTCNGEYDDNESLRLAFSYADAFMADVNWMEIARHMAENYPEWGVKEFTA